LLFAHGDEDRVVAEALVAARLDGDPAVEDAGAAQLLAGRRQCDQFADVAGAAAVALDVAELAEQAPDWIVAAKARRTDPRRAGEALDLEPGILAEHPGLACELGPVLRLGESVLVVRGALLGRIAARVQQLEPPVAEHARQLA
jgi:hypothetical protein